MAVLTSLAFLILTVIGMQKHSVRSQSGKQSNISTSILSNTFSSSPFIVVDCGHPMPPADGFLGDYQSTTEGSNVTYQCDQGFVPSTIFKASCIELGFWFPSPDEHICMETEFEGSSCFTRLIQVKSRLL